VDISPEVHCPHIGPTGGGKCSEDVSLHLVQDRQVDAQANLLQC
jgi:hypothetical protein